MLISRPLTRDEVLEAEVFSPPSAQASKVLHLGSSKTRQTDFLQRARQQLFSALGDIWSVPPVPSSLAEARKPPRNTETNGRGCTYSIHFMNGQNSNFV